MATQLLDFEKSDIGKDTLNLEMTDILEVCYKHKLMFDTIAQKKNIRILFSSDMNSYLTGVDQMKIEKIIDNLLSNAIKYSLPENIIEV